MVADHIFNMSEVQYRSQHPNNACTARELHYNNMNTGAAYL